MITAFIVVGIAALIVFVGTIVTVIIAEARAEARAYEHDNDLGAWLAAERPEDHPTVAHAEAVHVEEYRK